jgi:hypothetical protein
MGWKVWWFERGDEDNERSSEIVTVTEGSFDRLERSVVVLS